MSKYKHLFFDLDHTLWDFDANSKQTLCELYDDLELQKKGIPSLSVFLEKYEQVNDSLWALYRQGKISKTDLRKERFGKTLSLFKIEDETLTNTLDHEYITRSPYKTQLLPNTLDTLAYLHNKYQLHIITNGFTEVQYIKLEHSGLMPFFKEIITSDKAGFQKPDKQIFLYAMKEAQAQRKESLMIGDNVMIDVLGAKSVGMDQVLFNYYKQSHQIAATYEIYDLAEMKSFL